MQTTKCDEGVFGKCKRNASVTIPASAFTAELHFCRTHARTFLAESAAFYRRNA